MGVDAASVDAITFDSFTTLVDVRGSTRDILSEYIDPVDEVASLWRYRAVDYRMVSTFVGSYESYLETTRAALEYALSVYDCRVSSTVIDEIIAVFWELDVFGDVTEAVRSLAQEGFTLAVVSNGEPALLNSIIERAAIESYVTEPISADTIQVYKPDSRIYEHAATTLEVPVSRIAHVTAPWYDVYGAMHAGMTGVWVNRRDQPWDRFDGAPDAIVHALSELPELFAP